MSETKDWLRFKDFDVQIIKADRKRTASIVIEQGQLQLIVPHSLADEKIYSILKSKKEWIRRKLLEQKSIHYQKPKEYVSGECFSYLGKNHRLKVLTGPVPSVKLRDGYFVVIVPDKANDKAAHIRQLLTEWYIIQANQRLPDKVNRFAKIIGVKPLSIEVKELRTRWGACDPHGNIKLNWKIIMSPHQVIDYVVVHELCHLIHDNHSAKFWDSVSCYIPDYVKQKEWLRVFGQSLSA